jgi:LacI family transcriptional regulator
MPVTIKQIALKSGLSIQTVSQILNNKEGLYRKETRDKVLLAAEHLGYRPNSSAQAMRRPTPQRGAVLQPAAQDAAAVAP